MQNSFREYFSQIYSHKTREYFREVISSFDNNNLRSATVMLYSLVICDILFKLQELKDMYNDSVAEEILSEINESRTSSASKSKSSWEKELLDSVYKKTQLFEPDTYCNINHLFDHRNFSAHPALNENYDLFEPNRETVAAHVRNMLEGVFVKPPIFIKVITDTLVLDLADKKSIYENADDISYEEFKSYLNNKYFLKMHEEMYIKIFKALWKFVYVIDNQNCIENLKIKIKSI